nr:nonsense-mediated mRNA decay protein 2-like [Physcomitrium patens]|eukprot:XP_024370362.1 nonsense-mediated mRNA decay protein 2-like [Physcomitrella patens]
MASHKAKMNTATAVMLRLYVSLAARGTYAMPDRSMQIHAIGVYESASQATEGIRDEVHRFPIAASYTDDFEDSDDNIAVAIITENSNSVFHLVSRYVRLLSGLMGNKVDRELISKGGKQKSGKKSMGKKIKKGKKKQGKCTCEEDDDEDVASSPSASLHQGDNNVERRMYEREDNDGDDDDDNDGDDDDDNDEDDDEDDVDNDDEDDDEDDDDNDDEDRACEDEDEDSEESSGHGHKKKYVAIYGLESGK